MRLPALLASLGLVLACIACAPRADVGTPPPATAEPAPPVAAPARPSGPAAPDASCQVAADCTVKNVGNCCGYFPACVNKDATPDPDAVRAECERSGTASVCGFRDIQACDCVQNRCQSVDGPIRVDR